MFDIVTAVLDIIFLIILLWSFVAAHYDHIFHKSIYDIEKLCKDKASFNSYIDLKIFNRYLEKIPELMKLIKLLELKVSEWDHEEILKEIDTVKALYFFRYKK